MTNYELKYFPMNKTPLLPVFCSKNIHGITLDSHFWYVMYCDILA